MVNNNIHKPVANVLRNRNGEEPKLLILGRPDILYRAYRHGQDQDTFGP